MGALIGGAAIAGVVAGSKSLFDSAQDVAFNDPEADKAFTGHDFGPGFFASQAVGGPVGAAGRALSPLGLGGLTKASFFGGIAATGASIAALGGGAGSLLVNKRIR